MNKPASASSPTLAQLKVSPPLAWPTVLILVSAVATIALSWFLTMNHFWPLWLGVVANSVAGYALFTPAHEAIHRAAAQKPKTNDFLLAAATFVAVPFGKGKCSVCCTCATTALPTTRKRPGSLDGQQPVDHAAVGFWPFIYNFLRNPDVLPNVKPAEIWRELAVAAVTITALFLWKPYEALMLWLIPPTFPSS